MVDYGELLEQLEALRSEVSALRTAVAVSSRRAAASTIDSGDSAWMLVSTALVLFMTIPGLALFYSGMVRIQNVLATAAQAFSITCLITFLWLCFGYSLSFSPTMPTDDLNSYEVYGGGQRLWLVGLSVNSVHMSAPSIPEAVFCAYQLTFAIITPSLITGAFADRMR